MYAIEFPAKIKDGMIEVPLQYRSRLQEKVKVIILMEESEPGVNMIDQLLASPLKIANFRPLSRDEANERNS